MRASLAVERAHNTSPTLETNAEAAHTRCRTSSKASCPCSAATTAVRSMVPSTAANRRAMSWTARTSATARLGRARSTFAGACACCRTPAARSCPTPPSCKGSYRRRASPMTRGSATYATQRSNPGLTGSTPDDDACCCSHLRALPWTVVRRRGAVHDQDIHWSEDRAVAGPQPVRRGNGLPWLVAARDPQLHRGQPVH